jgi:Fur family ferric uptake transcriptional regulator
MTKPNARRTEQKHAIAAVVAAAGRPLTAQEVLDAAQSQVPSLGLATVYRNLKSLTQDGKLHPVKLPDEPVRYEPAHLHHHHHFQCTTCNRVFDVDGCALGLAAKGVPEGFRVTSHEVTFYGLCADCPQ